MTAGITDLATLIDDFDGAARTVLRYGATMGRLVDEAKLAGFDAATWPPLTDLVDTAAFVRVGNFKEVMSWAQYAAFLNGWAASAEWACTFKGLTEAGGRVFLELEERSSVGDFRSVVNSLSVFGFGDSGLIERIDVYLQMELPSPELLSGYAAADPAP